MTKPVSAAGASMDSRMKAKHKPKGRRKVLSAMAYRMFFQATLHAQGKRRKSPETAFAFGVPSSGIPRSQQRRARRYAENGSRGKYPGLWFASLDFDEPYPSGESPATFYKRIRLAWTNFKIVASENKMTPLLVTHGGVINAILCIENGAEFTNKSLTYRIPHAGIVEIR